MAERRTASKPKGRQNLSRGRQDVKTQMGRRVTAENKKVTASGVKRRPLESKPIGTTFQSKLSLKSSSSTTMSLSPKQQAAEHFLDQIIETGMRAIRKEFVVAVRSYTPPGPKLAWRILENQPKNRYEDVDLLDETRVKLKNNTETGKPHDDYIHANYVKVHDDLMYICAQGPLTTTIHHFWMMVIQERSKIVLQLCHFVEDQKEKCAEYFPNEADGSGWKKYGPIEVRALDRSANIPTMKKVVKTKLQVRYKEDTHDVLHILYGGWPDHSVAESVTCCREVRSLIHRMYDKKPIVAHCSAGVGRTGTFVAIEMIVHRINDLGEMNISVPELVKELRNQRFKAIQNDQQYVFVFRAVIEILASEDVLEKGERLLSFVNEYEELVARKRADREKVVSTKSSTK